MPFWSHCFLRERERIFDTTLQNEDGDIDDDDDDAKKDAPV